MHSGIRIIGLALVVSGSACSALEELLDPDDDDESTGEGGDDDAQDEDDEDGDGAEDEDDEDGDDAQDSGADTSSGADGSPTSAEPPEETSADDDGAAETEAGDHGEDPSSTAADDPTDAGEDEAEGGVPVDCAASATCDGCVQCSIDDGDCEALADTCELDPECVEISDCALGCIPLAPNLLAYTQCIEGCSAGHPAGQPEFYDLLGCLESVCYDACV
jgi:hypothetical protein